MKQSAAKKLSILFKMLVLAGCVLLCIQAFRLASGHAATAPVGLVQNTAVSYLDGELFAQVLEEENLPCLTAATGSNPDDAAALLQQGVGFLAVCLEEATLEEVPGLIAQAKEAGATILFAGHRPQDSLLETYDKAWYLGSSPAQGGEVMGQALAMAFREGDLQDNNLDGLLQYLFYTENADRADLLTRFTLEECEHYGVFSAAYSAAPSAGEPATEEDPYAGLDEIEKQLAQQQEQQAAETPENGPELILWAGSENQSEAENQARLWEGSPLYTAAFAYTPAQARAFADAGCGTVVGYDQEAVTRLAAQLAFNRENGAPMPENTGLSPDGRSFLVPYRIFE